MEIKTINANGHTISVNDYIRIQTRTNSRPFVGRVLIILEDRVVVAPTGDAFRKTVPLKSVIGVLRD